jgi:hypothetical protein
MGMAPVAVWAADCARMAPGTGLIRRRSGSVKRAPGATGTSGAGRGADSKAGLGPGAIPGRGAEPTGTGGGLPTLTTRGADWFVTGGGGACAAARLDACGGTGGGAFALGAGGGGGAAGGATAGTVAAFDALRGRSDRSSPHDGHFGVPSEL